MAGGPFNFHSLVPITAGKVFPWIHVGAGAYSKHEEGVGVMASLDGDATVCGRILLPPAIPSGTPKLLLRALAPATSGVAKVNPKCARAGNAADPSSTVLTALGVQTLTWAAGDSDKYKDVLVDLSALGLSAADIKKALIVDLVFETSGWTLSQVSTWQCWLLFE